MVLVSFVVVPEVGVTKSRNRSRLRDVECGTHLGGAYDAPERPPGPVHVDGSTVVAYGLTAVRRWVDTVLADTATVMSTAGAEKVWLALEHVVTERERVDSAAAPPPSLDRVIWTAVGTLAMSGAALLASLELIVVSRSWWIWAAGSLVMFGIGLGLRSWRLTRLPATGGLIGLATVAVLAAANAVIAALR